MCECLNVYVQVSLSSCFVVVYVYRHLDTHTLIRYLHTHTLIKIERYKIQLLIFFFGIHPPVINISKNLRFK